jgi:predicted secreted protein
VGDTEKPGRSGQMNKIAALLERLQDRRSRRVVFVSHCLLNENTRYLGGACTGRCVKGVVEQCLVANAGIVQMPCPEQLVWGGVLKRWLLGLYGSRIEKLGRLRTVIFLLVIGYTRWRYRAMAARIADQIKDYLQSGFAVIGIVGVDGSPSCGVNKTLEINRSLDLIARFDVWSVTVEEMNSVIRSCVKPGNGLFIEALSQALERRRVAVPFHAFDLLAELDDAIPDETLFDLERGTEVRTNHNVTLADRESSLIRRTPEHLNPNV